MNIVLSGVEDFELMRGAFSILNVRRWLSVQISARQGSFKRVYPPPSDSFHFIVLDIVVSIYESEHQLEIYSD